MADPTKNFGVVTLESGPSSSATQITLLSGHGTRLPDPDTDGPYTLVIWNATDYNDPTDAYHDADPHQAEFVRVTSDGANNDIKNITRATELPNTVALDLNLPGKTYKAALTITKKTLDDLTGSVSKSGDTMTGNLTIGDFTASRVLSISTPNNSATAGTIKMLEASATGFDITHDSLNNKLLIKGGTADPKTTRMSILRDTVGVGIGNDSPSKALDVTGDVRASTSLITNTISENTPDAGVTIDNCLIKDGLVDGVDVSVHAAATTNVHGATATSTPNSIPIADGSGKLNGWIDTPSSAGDTVVSETSFGQPATAGTQSAYSRKDHTHGTPADPVPTHAALTATHGATGAVMGTTNTQTVQNKTLDNTNIITVKDTNLTIQDETTTSKQLKFELSGISASTTRTLTIPDQSSTIEVTGNKAQPSGYPSLDSSSKVVQDPANATATPTANKIPIADSNGKLNSWVDSSTTPGNDITTQAFSDVVNNGSLTTYARSDHKHGMPDDPVPAHNATTTDVHGIGTSNSVVGTGTTQDLSAKTLNKPAIKDVDATPIADRKLTVINGIIKSTTTADVEGRYISKSSLETITDSEVSSSAAIAESKLSFNTTTGHTHNGTDAKKVIASSVTNTAAGNISSTDVQAAINELDTEKLNLTGGTLTGALTVKDTDLIIQDDADTSKKAKFQCSSISASTTRTYTLPNASVTLVGNTDTQTVQNKTLDNTNTATIKDANLTIQDNTDTTKQAKFECSGITTATTRTYTLPDQSSTIEVTGNKAQPSGYPSLDSSSKVVQDPANATVTPTANKIPIADASGKLNSWVDSPTSAGDTVTTQAFGDANTAGAASTYSRSDHKHGMMTNPVTAHNVATDVHGIGTSNSVVGTGTTQTISNKTFQKPTIDDLDATPVADRRITVIDGIIKATTTSDVEGRYISKSSLETITDSEVSSSAAIAESKLSFNTTTGHTHNGTDAKKVIASSVTNTAAGNIAATDVQAAINELDTEKVAKAGDTITGQTKFTSTQYVSLTGVTGALIIGGDGTGQHIAIDGNEIMSKSNGTTAATLILNYEGGSVNIGSGGLRTDTISEVTTAAGVTIDECLIKDGNVDGVDVSAHAAATTAHSATGAVMGTTNTQTVQNKTLDNTNMVTIKDDNLTIQDGTTTSKQLKFELSGISASTTRTLTIPDANTTILGHDTTQTLSNKTIDDDNNTITNIDFATAIKQSTFSNQGFYNYLPNGDFESWSAGAPSTPYGWSISGTNAAIAKDTTNYKIGTASAAVTTDATNNATLSRYLTAAERTYFASKTDRTVTFGAWVKASVANKVRIAISDVAGTTEYDYSSYHTGGGGWEYLTVPRTLRSGITSARCYLIVYWGGITANIDGAILVEGSIVPAFSPKLLVDDARTLTIDSVNNRVGINDTTPSEALDITGNMAVTGTVTMIGDLSVGDFSADRSITIKGSSNVTDTSAILKLLETSTNGFDICYASTANKLFIKGGADPRTTRLSVLRDSVGVGIGNESPGKALDVTGDIRASASVITDTISEKTTDTGVTIDSCLIKDGNVDGVDISTHTHNGTDSSYVSISSAAGTLSSDVLMSNASVFYDGPSKTLTAGTWFVTGTVTIKGPTSSAMDIRAKLHNNTLIFASSETNAPAVTGLSSYISISLSGLVIVPTSELIKISCLSNVAQCKIAVATSGGESNASTLNAIKIA